MVAPLMTCSARLPVYAVIIAAFISWQRRYDLFNLRGLVLFSLYVAGVASAALIAWLMQRGGRNEQFPLLLELPSYRWPDPLNLARGLWGASGSSCAGWAPSFSRWRSCCGSWPVIRQHRWMPQHRHRIQLRPGPPRPVHAAIVCPWLGFNWQMYCVITVRDHGCA